MYSFTIPDDYRNDILSKIEAKHKLLFFYEHIQYWKTAGFITLSMSSFALTAVTAGGYMIYHPLLTACLHFAASAFILDFREAISKLRADVHYLENEYKNNFELQDGVYFKASELIKIETEKDFELYYAFLST